MAGSARAGGRAFVVEEESICDRGFDPVPSLCDIAALRHPSLADQELVEGMRHFAPDVAAAVAPAPTAVPDTWDDATMLAILNELADELARRAPGLERPTVTTFERGFRVTSASDPVLDLPSSVDAARCERWPDEDVLTVADVERCAVASLGRPELKMARNPNIGGGAWGAEMAPAGERSWRDEPLWVALDALFRDHGQGRSGFVFDVGDMGDTKGVILRPLGRPQ